MACPSTDTCTIVGTCTLFISTTWCSTYCYVFISLYNEFIIVYIAIPVKQSRPVHPLTHVQLLGDEHSILVPHGVAHIAVFLYVCILSSQLYI